MNPMENINFSKWGWWLAGGVAMAGIGGWYAMEFQSQQRQVTSPPSPSLPLPIQGVSPQFTDKPTATKPELKPTTKAKKLPREGMGGIGGASQQIPASGIDGMTATTTIPQSGAARPMMPDAETVPGTASFPSVTQPNLPPAQVSAPAARPDPVRRITTAAPVKPQKAAAPVKPAPEKSQPSVQQAKVQPPAPPAPAASNDSGAAGSTFVPEGKALFGTTPAAPNAQSYAAGNSNPLPPIEPAQIPATTAPAPAVPSSNDAGAAPAPDLPPESMPRPAN